MSKTVVTRKQWRDFVSANFFEIQCAKTDLRTRISSRMPYPDRVTKLAELARSEFSYSKEVRTIQIWTHILKAYQSL
jgi:hypothetical protein